MEWCSGATALGKGWTEQYTVAKIRNINTSSNEKYMIVYRYYFVDIEHPEYVGITMISIEKESDNEEKQYFKITF